MPIETLLLLTQNKYLYFFIILVGFFLLSKFFLFVSGKVLLFLAGRTKTRIDDLIVKKSNMPISWILFLIGLDIAILPLGLKQNILIIVQHVISTFMTLIITYLVIIIVEILLNNLENKLTGKPQESLHNEVVPLFKKFSRILISFVGLLFILPIWGLQIGPLLAGLGIAGIAVAFAMQTTLSNIFGGASILLDKSVKVGDQISVENGPAGTVLDIGLRSTKIRTTENELVTIPNGKLADSKIMNFGMPDPRVKISVDFGVEYGSDIANVKKIVLEAVQKNPGILKKPSPEIWMTEMADSSLKFRAEFWSDSFDIKQRENTKFSATEKIYIALVKSGIGIPFPTRMVYIKNKK